MTVSGGARAATARPLRRSTYRMQVDLSGGVHHVSDRAPVVNTRLRELREAGLVITGHGGYELTEQGSSLLAAGQPLVAWADDWVPNAR
ncbi:MAG: hypothetical protein JWN65_2932 [Solirubrobacterales bacterium]|nr:hypothetical protein [Solirubrobacterales bacterium]